MDETHTTASTLTALAQRTGVEEYRLAMFGALLSLPLVSAIIAVFV